MTAAAPSSISERPSSARASTTSSPGEPPLRGRKGRFDYPEQCTVTIVWKAINFRAYKDLRRKLRRVLKQEQIYTAKITLERTPLEGS